MRYYFNWRYWLHSLTIKDIIIASFVMIIGFQFAFISHTAHIVNKLNEENEQLELQNERLSHLLDLSLEALQRAKNMPTLRREESNLRDPFRPDHPTRNEAGKKARGE